MKLVPVRGKRDARLADGDARAHGHVKSGDALDRATAKVCDRIADLQRMFYADARRALLIVLQGRDAAGKDGTIRRVFSAVNPQGCMVTSFGVPSEEELHHDYLWRVHKAVPPRRMIGIFNRSHYEDVLVPRVRGHMTKKVWSARCEQINDFERMLVENDVVILKFMLHVSQHEQRERLRQRLADPEKNWKFQPGDLEDRARWADFTKAYRGVLERTSTTWAPWYVVPADNKAVRDWLVARHIADTMSDLGLRYPKANADVLATKIV